jgi:alpha-L-fucosidase 2
MVTLIIGLMLSPCFVFAQNTKSNRYIVWDDQPAPNRGGDPDIQKAQGFPYDVDWEMQSYPLGNGFMGANFFGRTDTERLQITEKTLLNKGMYGIGSLTNFAEIYIDFNHHEPTNYRRSLNISEAIANIQYTQDDVTYSREYFMSYPDRVMAIKLSADQKGKISFLLHPEVPYLDTTAYKARNAKIVATEDLITISGTASYYSINYEAQIKVQAKGGTVSAQQGTISVSNADEVVLIMATGTNYQLSERLISERKRTKKLDLDSLPHENISKLIEKATNLGYNKLKERHLKDYQNLFSRVTLNLNGTTSKVPTKTLLDNYKNGSNDPYLEELMFQFGRYLLIASSRQGALPSGLQGVWSQYQISPWTGGFWHNINIQMNYWGAFNTNLAETFIPYMEYYKAYLPEAQRQATRFVKRNNPSALVEDDNGWTIGTAATPFEIRPPGGHSGPGTSGFTSKLFWDYFDFTRDTLYLRETGYPALLGTSKFLAKTVKPFNDGLLLVEPSASPEQMQDGKYYQTKGATFDQGFVWENHNDLLKAAEVLNSNDAFLKVVKEQINHLDPILIGQSGQVKEFREEDYYGEIGEKTHRHISHLCPLYPGTLINSSTPDWIEASKVTLNLRGNETTGWAMAHRMNLRARTKEGDKAYEVYSKFIKERTLPNLWTTHPPFQIDGSLGCVAGLAEMLLQSHEGYIEPLAALPKAWTEGAFSGLVARGNFEISTSWKNGQATQITVLSKKGGTCTLHYPGLVAQKVKTDGGSIVQTKTMAPHTIRFNTEANKSYSIDF